VLPWLIPLLLISCAVFLYPLVEIIRLSFTNAGLIPGAYHYTFNSYRVTFASPGFLSMVVVTLVFVAASVFFQLALGFAVAFLIDYGQRNRLPATLVIRTVVLASWAIPGVVIGIIWKMLYSEIDSGVLTYVLHQILPHTSIQFLSRPGTALISATVANIWRGTAYSMILLYAGLQTFPRELSEAATIDRANGWQRFAYVMLPVLSPILLITAILVTVQTFNTFDMILALTGGGPGIATQVIALDIYTSIFQEFDLGGGAAISVLLLAINVVMTLGYMRLSRRGGEGIL